ncbi:hypothetical protein [Mycobacterium riyadhense]|uniref:hypothetical protein n=1 Tax=Mycobacterium riyadhense TaxID=486698 RepID=UPI001956C3BD|nr:hypothetical protein [Mycobacterium riyadhense]
MAAKFTLDATEAEVGLSTADAAVAQQSGSNLGSLCIGGYMTSLVGAAIGARAVDETQTDGRAAANTGSREFSITTVQSAEAGNSSVLMT